jgi:hypothetical protein
MMCTVIPAVQEAEIGRIVVPGQPEQKKFLRPDLNRKSWALCFMPVIPATAGSINKQDCNLGLSGQKARLYLKNAKIKKGWRVWLKLQSTCLTTTKP